MPVLGYEMSSVEKAAPTIVGRNARPDAEEAHRAMCATIALTKSPGTIGISVRGDVAERLKAAVC